MSRGKLVRRILLWSSIAMAGIALIFAIVYVVEDRLGRRAWERYEASAQQRGVKLKLSAFIAPDVPDAENFAVIPILRDAFKASPQAVPDPFRAPGDDPRWYDSTGKPTDLAGWHKRLIKQKWLDQPSGDPVADFRRVLAHYDPALEQLRAASGRPHARFGNDWSKPSENRNLHFSILQNAVTMLSLRMRMNLAAGNNEAALGDWRLGQRLCRAIGHEPTIISGLMRIVYRQQLVEAMQEGLATHRWTADALRSIAADLSHTPVFGDYAFALQSERAYMNAACDEVIKMHPPMPYEGAFTSDIASVLAPMTCYIYPPGWVWQSQVRFNECIDTMVARIPSNGRVDTTSLSDLLKHEMHVGAGPLQQLRHQLAYLTMSAYGPIEAKFLSHHTLVDQARLGCALELHRLETGTFPATLAELGSAHVPSVPIDVWSGKPLRYQRTEKGYRLWAIGEDRTDNEGIFDPEKKVHRQKDVIWQIP